MKRTVLILFCFLIIVRIAYSAIVEVGIAETLEGNISSITYDNTSNIAKISVEFYNTGSVPFKARIKAEIFNESDMLFSGWGKEEDFMSGDKKVSDIYWYTNNIGDYFAKIKVYFGNDVVEYKRFGFSITKSVEPEDVFEIKNLRTYDDHIIFDLDSRKEAENVIVIPTKYTPGWIFEQAEVGNISGNSSKLVVMKYYPTIWKPSNTTLAIVSDKGTYYTEETVEMSKNEGLVGLFYFIVDSLRMAFMK
jgi:hypothetical protein